MSLVALLKRKGANGFGYGSTAEQVTEGVDLSGKTYLLTGCNSGLGFETLHTLSRRGAHVIATARSLEKAQVAVAQVGLGGTPVACELSEPESVRACVAAVKAMDKKIDGIICNAGIMALPRPELKFGIELQFLTNHLGHFILVTGLLEQLAEDGRVVMVSSGAHKGAPKEGIQFDNLDAARDYTPWGFYGQSKLANLLFARQLARRLEGTAQTANALHPGVISTNLGRHMSSVATAGLAVAGPLFLKTIPQGAATQCYLAAHPDGASHSGEYFSDCNPASSSPQGQDDALAERLWSVSEEIVAGL